MLVSDHRAESRSAATPPRGGFGRPSQGSPARPAEAVRLDTARTGLRRLECTYERRHRVSRTRRCEQRPEAGPAAGVSAVTSPGGVTALVTAPLVRCGGRAPWPGDSDVTSPPGSRCRSWHRTCEAGPGPAARCSKGLGSRPGGSRVTPPLSPAGLTASESHPVKAAIHPRRRHTDSAGAPMAAARL